MKVAVTGASGGLGVAVCTALRVAGHAVAGIDRVATAGAAVTVLDVRDPAAFAAALAGADALVHLAALPNPAAGTPLDVWSANSATAGAALLGAAEAGVRTVVYASSQSVLGLPYAREVRTPDYLPVDEEHPCRPSDPYSASKLAGELLAAALCRQGSLDVTALRLTVIWHPADRVASIRRRLDAPAQGAKSLWAYVDVRDAAQAVVCSLARPQAGFRVLNVAAPQAFAPTPVPDLVREWFPELRDIRGPLAADTALFDVRRAEVEIGFRARYIWTLSGISG